MKLAKTILSAHSCCASFIRRCSSSKASSEIACCVLRSSFANLFAISLLRSQFGFFGATFATTSSGSSPKAFSRSTCGPSNSGAFVCSIYRTNHFHQMNMTHSHIGISTEETYKEHKHFPSTELWQRERTLSCRMVSSLTL